MAHGENGKYAIREAAGILLFFLFSIPALSQTPCQPTGGGVCWYVSVTGRTMINYSALVTDSARWQPACQKWDATRSADYLSIPSLNDFDTYSGTTSLEAIVNWANTQSFGGYMTFTTEYEYLTGQTGNARYPLSTFLYNAAAGDAPPPPPPATPGGLIWH